MRKQRAFCGRHFFRLQSRSFVELPTALCWDRASGGSQPLWFVAATTYEEGPGKNIPFSVENKSNLLAVMTLFFGSGFAAPFFIVRHPAA